MGDRELLGDLVADQQRLLVARGGFHGIGNARYKSSTNRAPRQSKPGTPGEQHALRLELKLLADVGLLGARRRARIAGRVEARGLPEAGQGAGLLAGAVDDADARAVARAVVSSDLLKAAVHEHDGMVNAAMDYDEDDLQPLFTFRIGDPGTSHAAPA